MEIKDLTAKAVQDIVNQYRPQLKRRVRKFENYKLENLPIQSEVLSDNKNAHNVPLAHDFRGSIVDTLTGYLFGKPVNYSFDNEITEKAAREFKAFRRRVNLGDLDLETGKFSSICGTAARLCYFGRDGQPMVKNLNPWEVFFDSELAFRVLKVRVGEVVYEEIWVYDDMFVKVYRKAEQAQEFEVYMEETRHLYEINPVIEFKNNNERKGDFDKVENLINAYDKIVSCGASEFLEWRMAILALFGIGDSDLGDLEDDEGNERDVETIKRLGMMVLPHGDAKYITKDLPVEFFKELKDTTRRNIYRFAQVVDLSDENFSGQAVSGISRLYQLQGMENKCSTKERKFIGSCRKMFSVLETAWALLRNDMKADNLSLQFSRNLPQDLAYYADVLQKLRGNVPLELAYVQIPFIENPAQSAEDMRKEYDVVIDLNEANDEL